MGYPLLVVVLSAAGVYVCSQAEGSSAILMIDFGFGLALGWNIYESVQGLVK